MVWARRHSCLPRPPTQANNDIQEYTKIQAYTRKCKNIQKMQEYYIRDH